MRALISFLHHRRHHPYSGILASTLASVSALATSIYPAVVHHQCHLSLSRCSRSHHQNHHNYVVNRFFMFCIIWISYRYILQERDREWERGRRRRDIQQLLIAFIVCFIIRAILERSLHILFFIVFSWYPSSSLSSLSTSSSSSS